MPNANYLTDDDVRILRRVVSWFKGGGPGKSSRPVPTRRRVLGTGGGIAVDYYAAVIPFGEEGGISAAVYRDDVTFPEDSPRQLIPGTGGVYKFVAGGLDGVLEGNEIVSTEITTVKSRFRKDLNASAAGKALVGHFINDFLVNLDCEEIDFPFPWPEQ